MAGMKMSCFDCGQVNRIGRDKPLAGAKCGSCGAKLMPGKAVEIDAATLAKAARVDDVPLVVDFWAPWCGPCRTMAPEFSKAAGGLREHARLVKLNTEDFPQAGQKHGIRGIPSMVAFQGGREVKRQTGAMRAPDIEGWVKG